MSGGKESLMSKSEKGANMKLFFVICSIFYVAASFAHPVTPSFIKEYGLNDYMFGVALSAMQTVNFLFSPFWGKITGYISSRRSMLIGGVGYAIGQLMFGFARTEIMVIVARGFAGIFTGAAFVSMMTYVVNVSPEEERGQNLTILATITSVGSAFGYLVGGLLGEISIMVPFLAQSALLFSSGILFFLVCKDDTTEDIHSLTMGDIARQANPFAAFLASRNFMTVMFAVLFVVTTFQNLGYTAYEQCFNYFIKDQYGFTSAYNGLIKGVVGIVSLAANATICMWIVKKTNVKHSAIYILGCCTLSIVAVVMLDAIVPFFVMNVFFFAFNAISIPLLQNLVAEKAKGNESNLVMGFYNATKSLGGIFGSLFAGFIYSEGPKLAFVFAAGALLISTLAAALYYRMNKKAAA